MSDLPAIVDDAEFAEVVSSRASSLLDLADRLAADGVGVDSTLESLTRPVLAAIHSEASQLEELLDGYGALGNERWRPFRGLIAAMKTFARVQYSLIHLAHALPRYRLLCEEGELNGGLLHARRFTARVLQSASRRLTGLARTLGLGHGPANVCEELLPAGRLCQDCALRHVEDVAGTVTQLATAFLNLPGHAGPLAAPPGAGDLRVLTLPTENELRLLAEDFHNLQALYDTRVARTDVERADPDLLSLRGHASVVYHLLDVAMELTHYRERHVLHAPAAPGHVVRLFAHEPDCIAPEELEALLRDRLLPLAARYVELGRTLAQQLLRRYAERGEITVPVPRYRGFHVRPSTLVARVAYHYGSAVSMTLEGETYDASSPLELFRANELINAKKRRWLAQEIGKLVNGAEARLQEDAARAVRGVLMQLAAEAKVILYEQPLPPIEAEVQPGDKPVLSFVVDAVARLQALGKIDIVTPVTATFRGDRRVLRDLQLLAANGYGEDAYGNNIALPEELGYLRR